METMPNKHKSNPSTRKSNIYKQIKDENCCLDVIINSYGIQRQAGRNNLGKYNHYGLLNGRNVYKLEGKEAYLYWSPNNTWTVYSEPGNVFPPGWIYNLNCTEICPEKCLETWFVWWQSSGFINDKTFKVTCQNVYECVEKRCDFVNGIENIDWGYYSTGYNSTRYYSNGNCSICMKMCSKDQSCQAVECGESYCRWWNNNKCNEAPELTLPSESNELTCLKGMFECSDKSQLCPHWHEAFGCDYGAVGRNCRKTCNFCSNSVSNTTNLHDTSTGMNGTRTSDTKQWTANLSTEIMGNGSQGLEWVYVVFAVYVFSVLVYICNACKEAYQDHNIYSKPAKNLFKSICFILAGYMALTLYLRYLCNDDSSSIAFKRFNESPVDRYPTFSMCLLSSPLNPLIIFLNDNSKAKFNLSGKEYDQLLKGSNISRSLWLTKAEFSNISQIEHDRLNIKLESLLNYYEFKTQNSENIPSYDRYNGYNEGLPFYVSHIDPDRICFTRRSEVQSQFIRKHDHIMIALNYLESTNALFHIYIHHPGQLIRALDTPKFATFPYHKITYQNSKITLKLNDVTVLRKRPSAKVPCDATLHDDDNQFRKQVIERAGCIPIYWKSLMPIDYSIEYCKTSEKMAVIFNAIKNKKDVMASYEQPCDYMKVDVGTTQQANDPERAFIEIVYMEENYLEIVNVRDFGFESFWSGVGGFVGIFLGYSLLQVPESLHRLWHWFSTKK